MPQTKAAAPVLEHQDGETHEINKVSKIIITLAAAISKLALGLAAVYALLGLCAVLDWLAVVLPLPVILAGGGAVVAGMLVREVRR